MSYWNFLERSRETIAFLFLIACLIAFSDRDGAGCSLRCGSASVSFAPSDAGCGP